MKNTTLHIPSCFQLKFFNTLMGDWVMKDQNIDSKHMIESDLCEFPLHIALVRLIGHDPYTSSISICSSRYRGVPWHHGSLPSPIISKCLEIRWLWWSYQSDLSTTFIAWIRWTITDLWCIFYYFNGGFYLNSLERVTKIWRYSCSPLSSCVLNRNIISPPL